MIQTQITNTLSIGDGCPLALIGGPCVIESLDFTLKMAEQISIVCERLAFPSSSNLPLIKPTTQFNHFEGKLRNWTENPPAWRWNWRAGAHNIHESYKAALVAPVVDVLQIPAFLCRQTDLLLAAAATGQIVNVKKVSSSLPGTWSMLSASWNPKRNQAILLTERGTSFGYNTLVVDFRSLTARTRISVVFDATHSVQMPGGQGDKSGQRQFVPYLARTAAGGMDALLWKFMRTLRLLPVGANMIPLAQLELCSNKFSVSVLVWEVARVQLWWVFLNPSCVSACTGEALALDVDGVLQMEVFTTLKLVRAKAI